MTFWFGMALYQSSQIIFLLDDLKILCFSINLAFSSLILKFLLEKKRFFLDIKILDSFLLVGNLQKEFLLPRSLEEYQYLNCDERTY